MYGVDDDDEEEEIRVFVNNQNTRAANVRLPSAPSSRNQGRRTVKRNKNNINKETLYAELRRTKGGGGGGGGGDVNVTNPNNNINNNNSYNNHNNINNNNNNTRNSNEIHPHLEDVYQRVMRRLQRRENYEELNHPSLAFQFGVIDSKNISSSSSAAGSISARNLGGNEEKSLSVELEDHFASRFSLSSSIQTQVGRNTNNNNNNNTNNNSSISNTSSRRRRNPPGREIHRGQTIMTKEEEVEEDTLFLSQQPCPKTLRLVLEQVTATVNEKLQIANTGSLKNCLRFVFESRGLLNRLLKEIPSYAQFQGDSERLPTSMQMQELYQEFRRQPVVIPGACYVRDSNSGRVTTIVGEEIGNSNNTNNNYNQNTNNDDTPQQQQQQHSNEGVINTNPVINSSVSVEGQRSGLGEILKKVAIPGGIEVTVPSSYGKSSRTRGNGGKLGHNIITGNISGITSSSNSISGAGSGVVQRVHHTVSTEGSNNNRGRNVVNNNNNNNMEDSSNEGGGVSSVIPASSISVGQQQQTTSTTSFSNVNNQNSSCEKLRRATQEASISVLTEINNTTIVDRDEYDKLQKYAEKLEVEIEEQKQEIRLLKEQLDEEKEYTTQKRKVVQYLRETLYKECSVLRSQLSAAQQKQIQYQTLLKEKQQALAYAVTAESRNGGNISAMESTRFPNISTTRAVSNETSMMMSFIHGSGNFRRNNNNNNNNNNPRASTLAIHRGSTQIDEHEEGNTSNIYGAASSLIGGNGPLAPRQVSVDISAIHSLLDLVLLAVENDQVLPANVSKAKNANMTIISNAMLDDPHIREKKMREEFLEKKRQMKESYTYNRVQTANLLAIKDHQIEYLKRSSDIRFIKKFWEDQSESMRNELKRIRNAVMEDLNDLKLFVFNTMTSIANRARVVDTTLRDNHSLHTTQSVLRDVIASARTLFVPMLTIEYGRGYHPWPLKLRNTIDPFSHMVNARYGEAQLLLVREEMNALSDIYLAVHQYVMKTQTTPQMKRPLPGPTLRQLCSSLVLNSATTSEVCMQVKDKYIKECEFQRQIAQLNVSIVSLMYRQRVLTERSAEAMESAGMDPRVSGLPVQNTINKIAEKLHKLIVERALLRKRRQDNARDVYRIWRSKQIDVNEGYAAPTIPQKLMLGEVDVWQRGLLTTLPTTSSATTTTITTTSGGGKIINAPELTRSGSVGKANTFWNRLLSITNEAKISEEVLMMHRQSQKDEEEVSETVGSPTENSLGNTAENLIIEKEEEGKDSEVKDEMK